MPIRFFSYLLLLFFIAGPVADAAHGQKRPGRQGTYALTNARIVPVTSSAIENGTVLVRSDTIAALGTDVTVPSDAEVIDASGLTVYPGLFDGGTRLGLVEVGSLDETRDFSEIGELTPQMKALTAVNPNSVNIPVTRVNGVTTVLTAPTGGLFPGTAALIDLHGYTPSQMHQSGVELIVLDFPSTGRRGRWDQRSNEEIEKAAKKAMDKLNETWDEAELYARIDSARAATDRSTQDMEYVPAMNALAGVVKGDMPLLVRASKAADIEAALEWADERGLTDQIVLSGAAEGWRVAEKIADANVPVIAGPVLSVPTRDSDRYDKPYRNAALLHDAGVQVALRTGDAENVRNLPFHAGFAAAYGMSKDDALAAITIEPARIFGVDDRLGSLEVGKQANLFVTDGDPFETKTKVRHLFIQGYKIPMESRHTKLYNEFLNRNPGVQE
ncbi:amidohydrolase [Longibacter salinarum]|uniref:Amidohydrolase n=1 Tax=Longibacter salinarum TaxID=1850348 RepID=A0A2A8D1Z5_9BACT|nr:amidohydrolase family protein [Longibacter salinarum]PEN14911.1 amidohydrolase [Longibacter salinarum]